MNKVLRGLLISDLIKGLIFLPPSPFLSLFVILSLSGKFHPEPLSLSYATDESIHRSIIRLGKQRRLEKISTGDVQARKAA